ncbi:MAG: 30S ribosomal protein S15 [Nanoarchaeota archaeon]|nr:30S ribosomal protein S15 [Nanoarchaeota archaeon]
MARMHSRRKGKSGSKRPLKQVASWAPYKEKEVEKLVVKFAKAGKAPSEIGLVLRDTYGVQSVQALTYKKITTILDENKLLKALPEDLLSLIKKLIAIKQHQEKNRQDKTALRGMQLTDSKIMRLIKYYKRSGRLAEGWKLDRDKLKMYVG